MGQCDNFFKKGVPPRLEEQSGRVQPPRGGKTWETRKALRLLAGTHPVVAPRQPETPGLRLPQDSRGGAKSSYVTVLGLSTVCATFSLYVSFIVPFVFRSRTNFLLQTHDPSAA